MGHSEKASHLSGTRRIARQIRSRFERVSPLDYGMATVINGVGVKIARPCLVQKVKLVCDPDRNFRLEPSGITDDLPKMVVIGPFQLIVNNDASFVQPDLAKINGLKAFRA
jgi:hypothetical protein